MLGLPAFEELNVSLVAHRAERQHLSTRARARAVPPNGASSIGGGPATWSVFPLDRALVGDFELLFDVFAGDTDTNVIFGNGETETR
jgi:hypothetical protein